MNNTFQDLNDSFETLCKWNVDADVYRHKAREYEMFLLRQTPLILRYRTIAGEIRERCENFKSLDPKSVFEDINRALEDLKSLDSTLQDIEEKNRNKNLHEINQILKFCRDEMRINQIEKGKECLRKAQTILATYDIELKKKFDVVETRIKKSVVFYDDRNRLLGELRRIEREINVNDLLKLESAIKKAEKRYVDAINQMKYIYPVLEMEQYDRRHKQILERDLTYNAYKEQVEALVSQIESERRTTVRKFIKWVLIIAAAIILIVVIIKNYEVILKALGVLIIGAIGLFWLVNKLSD